MCRSVRNPTPNRPISRASDGADDNPAFELEELAAIYVKRGVDPTLARQVAEQLMAKDALAPMRTTNSGSPKSPPPVRCKRR